MKNIFMEIIFTKDSPRWFEIVEIIYLIDELIKA